MFLYESTAPRDFLDLVHGAMRRGDVESVLSGGHVPYILRRADVYFRFVRECYVHGIRMES